MSDAAFDPRLRLAAIIESSDDAIIGKSLDGIVTSWNKAAERMFGYTAEEALGRSIRVIIPADRQREEDEVLARIRRGDKVEHFETIRRRKDGSLFPISLTVSPIRDEGGVVIGASKIARDISEQRAQAEALDRARVAQADLQQRLRALVDASANLLGSPRVSDVLAEVLSVAGRVLHADGFAVWRLTPGGSWQIRASIGVSEAFAAKAVDTHGNEPVGPLPFTEPLLIEDVSTLALGAERLGAYEAEGIRSIAAIPLFISSQATGSLTLYYRRPRRFTDVEVETAQALGNIAASALTTAELYEQQRRLRERAAFVAQASRALASSLDLEPTLKTVVELAAPAFADACAIHLVTDSGAIRLAASAHADPARNAALLALAARPHPGAAGWGRAVHEATVELLTDIDEAVIRETLGDDPRLHAAFEELKFTSQLTVPMRSVGRMLGTITFALGPGLRRYTAEDIELAEDLADRCATAIINAQLFADAQRREAEAAVTGHRATFLADMGAALASSLDYDHNLRTLVRLAVPAIGDWCAVDIVDESSGRIERLAFSHVDPARTALVQTAAPSDDDAAWSGPFEVIRTGKPIWRPRLADEASRPGGDARSTAWLRSLGTVSYVCVPLVAQGRGIGALSFGSADSDRHFSEADLRFAQDVAARAALAVENARAYAEANRANHLKDEFLATLSHELRTPLNAILGYTQMLRSGALPTEKHQRAFEILERNASALAQIVGDILDVSRIMAGKLRLNLKPSEVGAIVGDAIVAILPAAEARGVAVRPRIDPDVPTLVADGDRLQQVIWNLVSNAVKFTPRGGVVDVSVEQDDDAVAIVVRDTGVGIAPDFLPHVFERFRQGDSRFTREHGGLGLGLAIARHLVEMHGGSIQASSEGAGKGSTFRVQLPVSPQAVARPVDVAAERRSRSRAS